MHTLSSAKRTCIAWASAVECTATVWMPISRQARRILSAISPRLAISTLSNMGALLKDHHRLAELDRAGIRDQDARELAALGRLDLVHDLHGLDDQQGLAGRHDIADPHEMRR